MAQSLIRLDKISLSYGKHEIFRDFSCSVEAGEFLGIIGPSGSGKSSLLNMLGLLLRPTSGTTWHFGQRNLRINSRRALRCLRYDLAYLFQNYALMEDATVFQNLKLAAHYGKQRSQADLEAALTCVGLEGYGPRQTRSLSGGEQQRLAFARLLLKPAQVILADEPTGNLDRESANEIMELFDLLRQEGKSIVMVTHDPQLLSGVTRVIDIGGKA